MLSVAKNILYFQNYSLVMNLNYVKKKNYCYNNRSV